MRSRQREKTVIITPDRQRYYFTPACVIRLQFLRRTRQSRRNQCTVHFRSGRMHVALQVTLGSLSKPAAGRQIICWPVIIALVLFFAFAGGQVVAQEMIGTVSRTQGTATATRGSTTRTLGLNASVALNETLSTGPGARIEVVFKDDTRLTLGENAKLTLDRYIFDPAGGRGTIRFKAVGAFRF